MFALQIQPHPQVAHTIKLGHEIARLAAHIHAATYRFLVLIREFDRLGGWGDQGCTSCAHWLSWRCGISVHTGREKVRVAKALATLPKVSKAFEQRRISYSKARAITRVATEQNEEFLLGIALNGTASHLDKLVRHENRRRQANERDELANDPYAQRDIEWFEDNYGCVVFKVRLPPEDAARVIQAIEACQEQHFRDDVPAGTSAEPLRLQDDAIISTAAAKRICCDAGIVPMVEDAQGRLLDVGRKTRVISPALRRALNKRDDQTCRFPGCTHTRYLHGHHIVHWAEGGEICFTTPDGAVLPPALPLASLDELGESAQTFEDDLADYAIDKDTCLPNYQGDGMDYDLALQGLAELS